MSRGMTMTVRLNGTLSEFVASEGRRAGRLRDISEYVRDLIRRDEARLEQAMEERLRIELAHAFAAPVGLHAPDCGRRDRA